MAIGYTEIDFVNGGAPALNATNLNHMDEAIKDACDLLDAETTAGRALVEAADAAAQRSALGLGDSATKNVGTGAGDVAAGNAPAAAQAAAEATAAGALAGHVADADPHEQYQKEADLAADMATLTHGLTTKASPADAGEIGFWDSVASALKKLTFANLWTWIQSKIHAASNKDVLVDADKFAIVDTEASNVVKSTTWANIKAKIATFLDRASTTVKGIVLLGASGGAAKLTKMPDGATASYARDDWTSGADSWIAQRSTLSYPTTSIIRATWASSGGGFGIIRSSYAAKNHLVRVRANRACTVRLMTFDGSTYNSVEFQVSTEWTVVSRIARTGDYDFYIYNMNDVAGDWLDVDWIWIGDYSYLTGSLSEEAARIANLRGDMPGVGQYASQTITASTTTLPTAGKGDTIGGKKYTFVAALTASPGVEGEVLIDASGGDDATKCKNTLENLNLALSEAARTNNGTLYWAAAVHPLVSSARVNEVLTLTAKTKNGTENTIGVVCEAGTNHTAGGATLLGGYTDSAAKTIAEVQNNIAGNGTRPAAAKIDLMNTSLIGYETTVDIASGGTFTLPAGGTWYWNVYGYGATISSAKRGTSAGGTTLTVAGANASVGYRRVA